MLLLILFLTFIPQLALAENTPPAVIKGDFTQMKHTATGRVAKVIDADTVLLSDGKIVRLLGLEYPAKSEAPFLSKSLLERLLPDGTEVMLYQKRPSKDKNYGRINRMGHVLAHLVDKKSEQWINGVVIASGLAYAMTDSTNPEMADQLYNLENAARKTKRVLWADKSKDGLLTPDTASQGNDQFRVVEGVVNRAATSKNNLYLNFGNDWRKDFTVMISAGLRKTLSKNGTDPMALSGKKVRVRGWIREWNGPFMELETPQRIEILSTPAPTALPTEPSTDAVDNSAQTGQTNP